jgi:hypothetical protein
MIRAQARAEHQAETGHSGYRGTTDETGRMVCTECPWEYPPVVEPEQLSAYDADPGPEPDDAPDVPPLTLRDRITTAVENHFVEGNELSFRSTIETIVEDVHTVVGAGADWTPRTEGTEMTPAQALAFLLDLPEWSRISRLGQLLDQAEAGADCYLYDHPGKLAEITALHISRQRYHDALTRIARLTSTVDQPESARQNVIGQIAAEALTHRA